MAERGSKVLWGLCLAPAVERCHRSRPQRGSGGGRGRHQYMFHGLCTGHADRLHSQPPVKQGPFFHAETHRDRANLLDQKFAIVGEP